MFRIALLALALAWPSAAVAQPKTATAIDTARADIARFCAGEIQSFVKARKVEAEPNRKKTPEEEVIEIFEYLFSEWSVPPDLNLVADIDDHARDLKTMGREKDPGNWAKRILAETRMRICINSRATKHHGEQQSFILVQNKTASTAKFMWGTTNWGELEPGKTSLQRFQSPDRRTFHINVDDVVAYGPTTVEMKAGETLVMSFGDAGKALTVAQPPPLD